MEKDKVELNIDLQMKGLTSASPWRELGIRKVMGERPDYAKPIVNENSRPTLPNNGWAK